MPAAPTPLLRALLRSHLVVQPKASIVIAVDTAFVASREGRKIDSGVYFFDNQVRNGSSGGGASGLNTVVRVGTTIGFRCVAIDTAGGDTVIITGFAMTAGNVFSSSGFPRRQQAASGLPAGTYWIGKAVNRGVQSYDVQLELTVGELGRTSYFVNRGARVTAR